MTLLFATSNANKVREIASLLPEGITVQSLSDIGWTEELPETRDTIEGNSLQKAQYLAEKLGVACFAEDTGLIIDALDGRPGVYSARYSGPGATYQDNVNKVLKEMEGVTSRTARFKTVITYYRPAVLEGSTPKPPKGGFNSLSTDVLKPPLGVWGPTAYFSDSNFVQFTGLCEGTILTAPRGGDGFGYDPVFVPEGCNLSFAEMRLTEKNVFSHRKKALEQFLQYLKKSFEASIAPNL